MTNNEIIKSPMRLNAEKHLKIEKL